MKNRLLSFLILLLPAFDVLAEKGDYTYVKSSLAFPWFMFFVFFAMIMIPFILVIALAWRKSRTEEDADTSVPQSEEPVRGTWFHRVALPSILAVVAVFSVLLVLNAYEAMDLMEAFGTAAPTMLNARPE